jgi:hypothetical protein
MTIEGHNFDIDELESIYPKVGRETIEEILDSWDETSNSFLVLTPYRHTGELLEEIVGHDDIYNRYCHQPKKSSPDEIEEMIVHNKQLLSFLTDICGWDKNDPFYPNPEGIRRGY